MINITLRDGINPSPTCQTGQGGTQSECDRKVIIRIALFMRAFFYAYCSLKIEEV